MSAGGLAYVDTGGGPALVLLHGFPTSSVLWREHVHLLEPWFRVIAPDLLGYGESDRPEDARLDIRAQAGYVRELLGLLGVDRFAVVGHGSGGGIAQLLAFEGGVDAMVLLNSVALDAWPAEAVRELQALPSGRRRPELVGAAVSTSFDMGMRHHQRLPGDVLEAYRHPWEGEEGARAFFRALDATDGVGLADRDEDLRNLACPVLLVWGEEDPFLPAEVAERLAELIPDSTLALLPGCSHFVTEDAPETVAPLILEWLRARHLGGGHRHAAGPVAVELGRRPPGEGSV